jgi:hypothetical protein
VDLNPLKTGFPYQTVNSFMVLRQHAIYPVNLPNHIIPQLSLLHVIPAQAGIHAHCSYGHHPPKSGVRLNRSQNSAKTVPTAFRRPLAKKHETIHLVNDL